MKNIFIIFFFLPALLFGQGLSSESAIDIDSKRANIAPSKIGDLVVLGKVWGFLKYYHPAVADGDYNWDDELLRILPSVLECDSREERDRVLAEWISGMGKVKEDKRKREIKGEIKLRPDLGWIDSSGFDPQLVLLLNKVRNAERGDEHHYIGERPRYGSFRVKNENSYPEMGYPDAEYRLLSLYRYWNLVEYYFPYKYLIGEDWNKVLEEFIPKFAAASNELEYTLTVLSLITSIHDSHAGILANEALKHYQGTRHAALELSFIENKPVVSGYFNEALGKKTGLLPGDVILRINGKPVKKMISVMLPVTPGSNGHTRFRDLVSNLLRSNDTSMRVTYAHQGSVNEVRLATYTTAAMRPFKPYPDTSFRFIAPGIAYLHGGKVEAAELPAMWEKFKSTKGLIIDLRLQIHPQHPFYYKLCHYLLPEPADFVKMSLGSVSSPGLFAIHEVEQIGPRKNKDYYKGDVVILVNERSQSSSEFHTMALAKAPQATVIGSNTAGADGAVLPFSLPGRIETSFSGVGVYYPDGTETQRIGIIPDIEVTPTIRGIREGRDEVLEAAIELISSGEIAAGATP